MPENEKKANWGGTILAETRCKYEGLGKVMRYRRSARMSRWLKE